MVDHRDASWHIYLLKNTYIYTWYPPMYPHFCGVNIVNLEVKTCFHVLASNVQESKSFKIVRKKELRSKNA